MLLFCVNGHVKGKVPDASFFINSGNLLEPCLNIPLLILHVCVVCAFLACHRPAGFSFIKKTTTTILSSYSKMVFEILPVASREKIVAQHLASLPSLISKQQLPVSSIWNSEVHITGLVDLFQERHKIIHTTNSKLPKKLLTINILCALDVTIVNCLQAISTKNMCKTTKCYDIIRIP